MDGRPLRVNLYHNIPGTGLVAGYITLEDGPHTCSHVSMSVFLGLLYGVRESESYAVPAGMRVAHINNVSVFQSFTISFPGKTITSVLYVNRDIHWYNPQRAEG